MPDGEVVFEIKADVKDADKALDQFVKQAKAAGMDIDKAMADAAKSAGDSFQDMGKSFSHAFDIERVKNFAISAVKQIANFAKEAVSAASDLEEVQNVVDVTFGDSADQINTWAQAAGKAFGLTETQAKKFTSTLGAMMKSAGLTGDEITKMSTDMAGLAADMASFYNLDFDTAFQKIRSGLSGETEPLKQLGINLSVANLEAFALSQNLGKTFSSMSQGEQTVLRYQYIMQATADAQGDFARTSDGYANSLRLLETNIETLKTRLGTALVPIVSSFVSGINDMLAAMQGDLPQETILDKFAAINIKTADKIAEIKKTADEARSTVEILNQITGFTGSTESLASFVESFSGAVSDLSIPISAAQSGDYAGVIKGLGESLTSLKPGTTANDWSKLLSGAAKALADVKVDKNPLIDAIGETKKAVESPNISDSTLKEQLSNVGTTVSTVPAAPSSTGVSVAIKKAQDDANTPITTGTLESNLADVGDKIATAPAKPGQTGVSVAVAQAQDDANKAISTKTLEDNLRTVKTTIEDNPGALTQTGVGGAVDKVQSDANKSIDTTTLESNIGKIETAVAKAMPEDTPVITVLEAISGSTEGAASAIVDNGATIEEYMTAVAEWASGLTGDDAANWQTLMDALGDEGTLAMIEAWTGATTAVNNMAAASNALGGFSDATGLDVVVKNMKDLGLTVTDQADVYGIWQGLLDSIVEKIPALGAVISDTNSDLNTGKKTLRQYIDEWEELETLRAMQKGVEQKKAVYESDTSVQDANMKVLEAQAALRLAQEEFAKFGMNYESTIAAVNAAVANGTYMGYEYEKSALKVQQAMADVTKAEQEAAQAATDYAEAGKLLDAESSILTDGINQSAESFKLLSADAQESVKTILTGMAPALEQMAEMYESTRESIRNSVENMFDGFEFKMPELGGKDAPEADSMIDSLKDQIEYMNEYMDLLEKARQKGVSAEILGSLSSGSVEDAEYLKALAEASTWEIEKLNEKYAEAKQKREEFTDTLTASTLAGDETFTELQQSVNESMSALTIALGDNAPVDATEQTVAGILAALKNCTSGITSEIDAIIAQFARLEGVGIRGFTPSLGTGFGNAGGSGSTPNAGGLDYVPFNGYLARLHEGESVLTREQSREWRSYSQGAQNASALDYAALGGVIRDNAPKAGGNVYLDGSAVGRVISDRQADSYRMLERSGWQG